MITSTVRVVLMRTVGSTRTVGNGSCGSPSTSLRSLEILDSLRLVERAIGRELGLPAEDPAEAGQFTSSLEAFDDYLAGLQLLRGGTADAFELARKRFRSAQLASPFTMARIYEAIAVMARLEIDPPPEVSRPAALRAVALMLEEIEQGASVPAELYAARLQLANLEDRLGSGNPADDQQRRDWFERATALRPSFVEPYLSYADSLERAGRDSEARRFRKQAKEFMPMGR